MNKYFVAGVSAVAGAVGLLPLLAFGAPLSTTTLGNSIDTVSDTTMEYFGVLIAKF